LREVSRAQLLNRAVDIYTGFLWKFRRNSPYFLEMPNCAVELPSSGKGAYQVHAHSEICGSGTEDVAKAIFINLRIISVRIHFRERVENTRFGRRFTTESLERRARVRRAAGERVESCKRQVDVCVFRLELMGSIELFLCFLITARLQVSEAEVGVGKRIIRRELDELAEFRLSFRELISLEETQRGHSSCVQLRDGRAL